MMSGTTEINSIHPLVLKNDVTELGLNAKI